MIIKAKKHDFLEGSFFGDLVKKLKAGEYPDDLISKYPWVNKQAFGNIIVKAQEHVAWIRQSETFTLTYFDEEERKRTIELTREKPTFENRTGGPHDEGFSYTVEAWDYDFNNNELSLEITTNSCDCDGPLDRYQDLVWRESMGFNESGLPSYEPVSSSQRDHFAEAMGY